MRTYTIELREGKIFSHVSEDGAPRHLLRPHGDEFYPAEMYSDYWSWFAEEISGEFKICFLCREGDGTLERLKNSAPEDLKNFFTEYREDSPLIKTKPNPPKYANPPKSVNPPKSAQITTSNQKVTKPPEDSEEKISAQDLREYIEEQTGEHG